MLRINSVKDDENDGLPEGIHPEILEASESLYNDGHCLQAVFEACKVLIEKVRTKSGRHDLDGAELMFKVLSTSDPVIAFNPLRTKSDKSEQEGLLHMCAGAVMAIRNPRGHRSRMIDTPAEARELISALSFLVRRVDGGRRRRKSRITKVTRRSSSRKPAI
jgi:uncharacterized protein (TIGR02391 family)